MPGTIREVHSARRYAKPATQKLGCRLLNGKLPPERRSQVRFVIRQELNRPNADSGIDFAYPDVSQGGG